MQSFHRPVSLAEQARGVRIEGDSQRFESLLQPDLRLPQSPAGGHQEADTSDESVPLAENETRADW